jgi:hypothetical protein
MPAHAAGATLAIIGRERRLVRLQPIGPCAGAVAFLVDGRSTPGTRVDRNQRPLTASVIPLP